MKYAKGWKYYKIKNIKKLSLYLTGGIINNALRYEANKK